MNKKTFLNHVIILSIFLLLMTACQRISVPEDTQVTKVLLGDDLTNHLGKFITFFGKIDIPYQAKCTSKINDDAACPLYLIDSPHIINVIMGLNKNNVTSSGKIIFSDGTHKGPSVFGDIAAQITGLVKECNEKKSCQIDVYQLDIPTS